MADIFRNMQKVGPIFRGANGGLSDDLFTGIRNSFYYSNNMEVLEDANGIYPKQSPRGDKIDLGARNSVGDIVAVLYFHNSRYAFCQRNIFKLDFAALTATPLTNWMSGLSNNIICDAEIFNGYVYISTNTHLFRISQNAPDSDWGSQSNFVDISLNNSSYHPLYASDICLVVGDRSSVGKVTREIPDQLQDGFKLQSDYIVRFIDELGGFLRITATDLYYGSEILLWDKISPAANEVIPMNGYDFKQSCIYNGYHYLLSDKGFGLMNGYQYYILKKNVEAANYSAITNGMLVYDDKLHFVTSDGIFIYGAKNKNYTDVLSLWSARTDEYGRPNALSTDGEYLIFSEGSRPLGENTVHMYVYRYSKGAEKGTNGVLYTMGYYGTSLSEIKQAVYLRLGYVTSYGDIKVFYRTEADASGTDSTQWTWHELTPRDGLDKDSDARSPFATTFKLNCRFQWIQFKFEINSSSFSSDLPTKIYSADLYYNDMLD